MFSVAHPLLLEQHGDRPVLLGRDRSLTYAELARAVALGSQRFGPGRRLVGIAMRNDIDSVVTYLSALAGGHAVLLAPPCSLERIASGVRPNVLVDGELVVDDGGAAELHPDLALLLSTSGSSGSPKLARLSYGNLASNAAAIAEYLAIRSTDVAITTLPLHYCYALSVLHSHLLAGAAIRVTDASVTDPQFAALMDGVTTLPGVPHTFELLQRTGFAPPPTVRTVTVAGGRMAPENVLAWAQRGQREGFDYYVMYGQTEATARMLYLPPDLATQYPGAAGVPIPGGSVRIDDGELVYRGPNVMMGYARTPSDLGKPAELDELRTGDLARINEAGLVEIVGRRSRFAKVFGQRLDLSGLESDLAAAGETIWCAEGDSCLIAACLGDPDTIRPLLCRAAGLPPAAVRVARVADVPRTASGKPDYPALGALAAPPGAPAAVTVAALYAAVLQRDPATITPQDTFKSLGGDSLSYVATAAGLERMLGTLPPDWHNTPVGDLQPGGRSRWAAAMDTTVALRALAVLVIVASHIGVMDVRGGAHLLLVIAGYNFARFRLNTGRGRGAEVRTALGSVARIAVPAGVYLLLVVLLAREYGPSILFANNLLGPAESAPEWRYWYVEALVYVLLAAIAALALGHRVQRRWPYGFALAALGAGLLVRYTAVAEEGPAELYTPAAVLWLFAAGWALGEARTGLRSALAGVLLGVGMIGYFDDPWRAAFVVAGVALFVLVPVLPVPRPAVPAVTAVAAASLWIYLTHWQVYPPLAGIGWLALAAAVVVGVLAHRMERILHALVVSSLHGLARRHRPGSGGQGGAPDHHGRRAVPRPVLDASRT